MTVHLGLRISLLSVYLAGCLYGAADVLGADWTESYLDRSAREATAEELQRRLASPARDIVSLNGEWQARQAGEDAWHTVHVPGAYGFEGEVEFKRSFTVDSSLVGKQLHLVFDGISNTCQLFVNNEFVASHGGGRTSFTVALDHDRIHFGSANEIRVIVENVLSPRTSLPLRFPPRFPKNFGGIFRDVFLMVTSPVHMQNLTLRNRFSEDYAMCDLHIGISLANATSSAVAQRESKAFSITYELRDIQTHKRLAQLKRRRVRLTKRLISIRDTLRIRRPEFWSPAAPILYDLRITLRDGATVVDQVSHRIGFREMTIREGFYLNGKPLHVRGFDWFEDLTDRGFGADGVSLVQELTLIKRSGANAIRVMTAPPPPDLTDICDEIGLLVFYQAPLAMVPDQRYAELSFSQLAENYFHELVERDAWHPSFVAVGLGTDLQMSGWHTQNFVNKLKQNPAMRGVPLFVAARLFLPRQIVHGVDFVVLELFNKTPEQVAADVSLRLDGKPVIYSVGQAILREDDRTLTEGNGDIRSGDMDRLSESVKVEELQAFQLGRLLSDRTLRKTAAGFLVFSFADWVAARPNLVFGADVQKDLMQMGVLNKARDKRIAYDVVEAIFKDIPPIRMSVKIPSMQSPNVFPISGIALVLFFLFNYNRSIKFRGNLKRVFSHPHGFYTEIRDKRKTPGFHTFVLSFLICATLAIFVASVSHNLRHAVLFDEVLNLLIPSDRLKQNVIAGILNPAAAILSLTALFYVLFGVLILLLKSISTLFGQRLPLGQFVTLAFWCAANFIWLLPLAPIFHRVMNKTDLVLPVVALALISVLWFIVRLLRALRVVYLLRRSGTVLLGLMLVAGLPGSVAWYYEVHYAFFDYLPTYIEIGLRHLAAW